MKMGWLMFFSRFLSDKNVEKRYVRAGGEFGQAVSYLYMGECIGFKNLLSKWQKWEAEYARRGYRTLPIDDFIEYGGYGKPLEGLGVKRNENEKIVSHAQIYRRLYLGRIQPAIDFEKMARPLEPGETPASRIQMGTYIVPSTKDQS